MSRIGIIGAIHFGDLPPDNVHYSETLRAPAVWSGQFPYLTASNGLASELHGM